MSQKNETAILVLALLITAGLVGGGFWWFTHSTPPPLPKSPSGNTFAQVQNLPIGLFKYGGSTSWAPIRLAVDPAIQAARLEFRLHYVKPIGEPPGSTAGIRMLVNGSLDFAQSSRPILSQEYNQAQQHGFSLQQIPVAIDGVAVAVNPNLNISGLTLLQLKSIYTGKTTNWKQLGGPDVNTVRLRSKQGKLTVVP